MTLLEASPMWEAGARKIPFKMRFELLAKELHDNDAIKFIGVVNSMLLTATVTAVKQLNWVRPEAIHHVDVIEVSQGSARAKMDIDVWVTGMVHLHLAIQPIEITVKENHTVVERLNSLGPLHNWARTDAPWNF